MRTISAFLGLAGLLSVGCGSDPAAGVVVVAQPQNDTTELPGAVDTVSRTDVGGDSDATPGAGLDIPTFDPDVYGAEMGAPCATNSDCGSGFCVHGKDGDVCTVSCLSTCPDGWACRLPKIGGNDDYFLCFPQHVTLCRPCADSAICASGGSQDKAYCADLGAEGQFCVTPCDESAPCPTGYACKATVGKVDTYCLPDSGTCECDAVAKAQGMSTACAITTDAGTCPGARTCGLAGLGACEGQTPKDEKCNDLDDNCDGQTDEGFPTKGKPCDGDDLDQCADGVVTCGPSGPECQDDAASVNEACDNNKDDDCDGETDEGCCNTPGSACCANSTCSDPLSCQDGLCQCSQTASVACINGDSWNLDCHGNKTTVAAECGTCACTDGACNDQGSPTLVCNGGDVYSTDCAGENLKKDEECGVCSCLGGACLKSDQADVACDGGDVFFTDCLGTPTSKKDECGICGCSGGACVISNQAGLMCNDGDVWFTNCEGTPTGKSEDCGACGCVNGACEKNDHVARVCSGGDVFFTDCLGATTTLAEDCGACGCADGACVANTQAGTACGGSDVYYTDCGGNLTLKKAACGAGCGCSSGECNVNPTASTVCQGSDVYYRDCNGAVTTKKETCACGCAAGVCAAGACPCLGTPWGDVADGFSATAYASAAPAGTCASNAEVRTCKNGVLSGSYTVLACTNGCIGTPFGNLSHGATATAYSTASPGGLCTSVAQQRVCTDGSFSGSYTATTCVDGCAGTAWGNLQNGAIVTAYSSATPSGTCAAASETRTCNAGVLSGTYPSATCGDGCVGTPWGNLAAGASVTAYSSATPTGLCSAVAQTRTCNGGVLSGTYTSMTCANGCAGTAWGNLASGATVTAYSSATPAGTCAANSEIRTCNAGVLSGTFASVNCTNGCAGTAFGDLASGATVTAYSSATPAGTCASVSQSRTCTNGTLSGAYANAACTEGCTLPGYGAMTHGQTVSSYNASTVPCGSTCTSKQITCTAGSLSSGGYIGSCTVGSCCAANMGTQCDKGGSTSFVAGCPSDYVCASFIGIYYDSPSGCNHSAGSWIEYWFDGTTEWGASTNNPPGVLGDATSAYHCTYVGNGTYDPFKNVPNGSCFNSSAAGYGGANTWTKVSLGSGCGSNVYTPSYGTIQCDGGCR